ncbi:MAG: Exosortase EpsH-related protein, partial [Bacteroidota bacterium]|nr:Exosortase EpsH-related protein [Bacteroidota bacterium]
GLRRSIRVEEHCLAFPATIIFICAIALFSGSWKNKAWFIPLGIFCIILINLIRLLFVCYVFENFSARFYQINHSVVYVIVVYAFIFLMIVWWMNKYSKPKKIATP